jgi:hypothetical protein
LYNSSDEELSAAIIQHYDKMYGLDGSRKAGDSMSCSLKRAQRAVSVTLLAAVALCARAGALRAQTVPALLNYQGLLRDNNGVPINGTQNITFGIYGAATGGSAQWTETQSVSVSSGAFSVQLGAVSPLSLSVFAISPTYLQITVGSAAFMPRRMLLASPYAANSQLFQGHSLGDFVMMTAGNVGIGTTSPIALLDVAGAVYAASSVTASAFFGNGANLANLNAASVTAGAFSVLPSTFVVSGGDVGVGTTSPALKIDVLASTAYFNGIDGLRVRNNGVNPGVFLENIGVKQWYEYLSGVNLVVGENINNSPFDRVTFQQGGSVGIGTTNPQTTLDVAGPVRSVVNGTSYYMVPEGAIIMWSGSPSEIPAGWALCNGTNGTPNLSGSFIVGYNASDSDYSSIGNTGGSKTHSHSVTGRTELVANPVFGGPFIAVAGTSGGSAGCDGGNMSAVWSYFGGNGNPTSYSAGACAGYVGIFGTAATTDGRPPYYTLAYIMKL